jgi:hypothetical protein
VGSNPTATALGPGYTSGSGLTKPLRGPLIQRLREGFRAARPAGTGCCGRPAGRTRSARSRRGLSRRRRCPRFRVRPVNPVDPFTTGAAQPPSLVAVTPRWMVHRGRSCEGGLRDSILDLGQANRREQRPRAARDGVVARTCSPFGPAEPVGRAACIVAVGFRFRCVGGQPNRLTALRRRAIATQRRRSSCRSNSAAGCTKNPAGIPVITQRSRS